MGHWWAATVAVATGYTQGRGGEFALSGLLAALFLLNHLLLRRALAPGSERADETGGAASAGRDGTDILPGAVRPVRRPRRARMRRLRQGQTSMRRVTPRMVSSLNQKK